MGFLDVSNSDSFVMNQELMKDISDIMEKYLVDWERLNGDNHPIFVLLHCSSGAGSGHHLPSLNIEHLKAPWHEQCWVCR
jgi:hypothetical protein